MRAPSFSLYKPTIDNLGIGAIRTLLIGGATLFSLTACGAQEAEITNTSPNALYNTQDQTSDRAASKGAPFTDDENTQEVAFVPSPERGQKLFRQCQACHTVNKDGANRIGPNLFNIYGAQAGQHEGFKYSKAMNEAEIIWDEASLNAYIEKPSRFLPGTRMTFGGVKSPDKRADIIAYLETLKD